MEADARAFRVAETGGRKATVLENGRLRVMVDDRGGMVSELACRLGGAWINAHWIPEFRSNAPMAYDPELHGPFWKARVLYDIAGNFPCAPNFGSPETTGGVRHDAHGWAANEEWTCQGFGTDRATGAAWARFSLASPDPRFPLAFEKLDVLFPGRSVHYTSLAFRNGGPEPMDLNLGWHNTVGAPFLQRGCRISASARRWMAAPAGTEFDATGRLAGGVEFSSLAEAPLRAGGTCDIGLVPGPIGFTDFASGAVPEDAALGWSAVVNPQLRLAYASFFPGPASLGPRELSLSFNDLWMQYGGRPYTPWAAYEGGTDRSFCLGTENITAAFGNGLAYSRTHRELLGRPTVETLRPAETKVLRYGTYFAPYEDPRLDGGAEDLSRLPADTDFGPLRALAASFA